MVTTGARKQTKKRRKSKQEGGSLFSCRKKGKVCKRKEREGVGSRAEKTGPGKRGGSLRPEKGKASP